MIFALLDTLLRACIITTNKKARRQVSIQLLREPSVSVRWSAKWKNPLRQFALAGTRKVQRSRKRDVSARYSASLRLLPWMTSPQPSP